jgi:hypothetical protein
MKTNHILILLASFNLLFINACTKENKVDETATLSIFDTLTVPHQMKGYEIYSWTEGNKWYFSILVGTNRIKTYAEVISNQPSETHLITVNGIDTLKAVLNRFPEDEYVFWIGNGWLQSAWGNNYGNLKLPPQNDIDEIILFCKQKKLDIVVSD